MEGHLTIEVETVVSCIYFFTNTNLLKTVPAGGGYVKTVMSRNNDAPRGGNRKGPNGRAGTGRNAVDDDSSEVVAAKGSGVEDWSAGWSNEPPNGSKPQRGWGGSEASEKQKAADPNSWETASLGPW